MTSNNQRGLFLFGLTRDALVLFLIFAILILSKSPVLGSEKIRVFVSIPPQKYLVRAIGKDKVQVWTLVKTGGSPHSYEPTPKQIARLETARIYFTIGLDFERAWLKKLKTVNPDMTVSAMDKGLEKLEMVGRDHAGENPNRGLKDPHVWLSPTLAVDISKNVEQALSAIRPKLANEFKANFEVFKKEMQALNVRIDRILGSTKQKNFIVYHPSWGYFAHEFGLTQVPVEIAGKQPSARELIKLIETAKQKGIRIVFVQPEYSARSARKIARAIGGRVVVLDPLAENYPANLIKTAYALVGE